MTLDESASRLIDVLEAENSALARGATAQATLYVNEKKDALQALQSALSGATPDAALAARLREAVERNGRLLRQAIEAQGRVLVMVARAAVLAAPEPVRYCAQGFAAQDGGALALKLRA